MANDIAPAIKGLRPVIQAAAAAADPPPDAPSGPTPGGTADQPG